MSIRTANTATDKKLLTECNVLNQTPNCVLAHPCRKTAQCRADDDHRKMPTVIGCSRDTQLCSHSAHDDNVSLGLFKMLERGPHEVVHAEDVDFEGLPPIERILALPDA